MFWEYIRKPDISDIFPRYLGKFISYGKSSEIIDKNELIKIQKNFMKEKQKCKVDFHCFCNQGIDHVWIK